MEHKPSKGPGMLVRPLEREHEIDTLITLAVQEFSPSVDLADVPRRRRSLLATPSFDPSQVRGAFLDETYLGGYVIEERMLNIGTARLLTGCIGGVVTHKDHRMKGVGATLLRDALRYGQTRHHTLLLLNGIPNFYHRFDFIDVLDFTRYAISRQAVLALPQSPYQVRPATAEEIPTLLALYQRHYGQYAGSFTRTLRDQEHFYHFRARMPPLLVLSPEQVPAGYLLLSRRNGLRADEIAADNWGAALALLQYQAQQLAELGSEDREFWWPLPPNSPTLFSIADHLSLRGEIQIQPDTDWMARVAHLPTLIQALVPLWQERWRRSTHPWSGTLALTIDTSTFLLLLQGEELSLLEQASQAGKQVVLSQQALIQLLFSYRPVEWIAQQPKQSIPEELIATLQVLFPQLDTWIAGSDAF